MGERVSFSLLVSSAAAFSLEESWKTCYTRVLPFARVHLRAKRLKGIRRKYNETCVVCLIRKVYTSIIWATNNASTFVCLFSLVVHCVETIIVILYVSFEKKKKKKNGSTCPQRNIKILFYHWKIIDFRIFGRSASVIWDLTCPRTRLIKKLHIVGTVQSL